MQKYDQVYFHAIIRTKGELVSDFNYHVKAGYLVTTWTTDKSTFIWCY